MKKTAFVILALVLFVLNMPAYADSCELSGDCTIAENVFSDGENSCFIDGVAEYSCQTILPNSLSFKLAADNFGGNIIICGKSGNIEILLEKSPDGFAVKNGGKIIAEVLRCSWFEVKINISGKNYEIAVYDGAYKIGGVAGECNNTFAFCGIEFSSEGLYVKDIKIDRNRFAFSAMPVIYKTGEYVSAAGSGEGYSICLAQYNGARLTKTAFGNSRDGYCEANLLYDSNATHYKAFMFNSALSPSGRQFEHDTGDVFVSEISVNAELSAVYSDNTLNISASGITVPKEAAKIKCVITDTGAEVYSDITNFSEQGISLRTESLKPGVHTAEIYAVYDDCYLMPLGRTEFISAPGIPQKDMFAFCVGKEFYYRNGEKSLFGNGYIPLYSGKTLYLPQKYITEITGAVFIADNESVTAVYDGKEAVIYPQSKKAQAYGLEYDIDVYTDGFEPLYSLVDFLKIFDYMSYFDNSGILIIGKGCDEDFTTAVMSGINAFSEGFNGSKFSTDIRYWGTYSGQVPYSFGKSEQAYEGTGGYYMQAVNSSFMGVTCRTEVDENTQKLKFSFWAKASSDYSGNAAKILAVIYKNGTYETKFWECNPGVSLSWQLYSAELDITEGVTAVTFAAITSRTGGSVSGYLYLDDFRVERYISVLPVEILVNSTYSQLFADTVFSDSFENSVLTWQGIPEDWSYFNWGTSETYGNYGLSGNASDGEKSVYLTGVSKSFAGFQSDYISRDDSALGYTVTADIYIDENYANNPGISLMLSSENGFLAKVNGTGITESFTKNSWVRVTAKFSKSELDNYDYSRFRLLLSTSAAGGGKSGGNVYFDNVRLDRETYLSSSVKAEITADRFASWYILGDEVKYSADPGGLKGIKAVKGTAYDSDGNGVFEKTVSVYEFLRDGWKWTPDRPGYYQTEFMAIRQDGAESPVVSCYSREFKNDIVSFEYSKRGLAVVNSEIKPMNERNKKMYFSSHCFDYDEMRLANLLGFYGVRMHWIRWGDNPKYAGANPSEGVYDWTNTDIQFNNVQKAGFGGVAANIYGTPRWSVPEEHRSETGITVVGSYRYNNYAPENMDNVSDFCTEFMKKYGDKVDVFEFWNEPMMGSTAFWADTPESFAEMLKRAYTAVKAQNSNTVFSLGGLGSTSSYAQFYDRLLSVDNIYNYYDTVAFHGSYNVSERLNEKISGAHGLTPKPWWNSEGYFNSYWKRGEKTDDSIQSLYYLVTVFENIKSGAQIITDFCMKDYESDEYRQYAESNGGSASAYGMFRSVPYTEPKRTAVAAHTLLNLMQDDFKYMGERLFGNIRTVYFINGGQPLVAVWNAADDGYSLPSELTPASITDMEGRAATGSLVKNRLYWLTDFDNSFYDINWDNDTVLGKKFEEPYFNGVIPGSTSENVPEIRSHGSYIFNPSTKEVIAAITAGDYVNWIWSSDSGKSQPSGFNAGGKMYIDDEALYIMVSVSDNNHYASVSDTSHLDSYDSIQIAVDSEGTGLSRYVNEFVAVYDGTGSVLYKKKAASTDASVPDDFSPSGTILNGRYISVEKDDNSALYKIIIPISELYPFVYPARENFLRISVRVNDNDGFGNIGAVCFGGGLGTSYAPSEFGKLIWQADN